MKVLFLHGFGESSLLAGMSTNDLKEVLKGAGHELLDAPNGWYSLKDAAASKYIADVEYRQMVMDGDLDAFSWIQIQDSKEGGHRRAGFKDFDGRPSQADTEVSVTKLVDFITKIGGVDAIIGFSQGGELAYYLCEHLGKPDVKVPWADQLKFVGTFGSEDPFNKRGSEPVAMKNDVIFYISFGSKDVDAVHDSATCKASLDKAGARSVVINQVEGLDHHMPKNSDANGKIAYDKMLAEIAKAQKPFTPKPTAVAAAPAAVEPAATGAAVPDISDAPVERFGREKVFSFTNRAIDDLMNDPNTKMFTWEVPPEAPPGWGRGYEHGETYLVENCGLYRPDHPKWKELHPEGVDAYWEAEHAKDPRNRQKSRAEETANVKKAMAMKE